MNAFISIHPHPLLKNAKFDRGCLEAGRTRETERDAAWGTRTIVHRGNDIRLTYDPGGGGWDSSAVNYPQRRRRPRELTRRDGARSGNVCTHRPVSWRCVTAASCSAPRRVAPRQRISTLLSPDGHDNGRPAEAACHPSTRPSRVYYRYNFGELG